MNLAPATVIDFFTGSGLAATLLVTFTLSLSLGWYSWQRGRSRAAEYLCLTSASLLVCSTIPLPYMVYGAVTGTDSGLWSGPLDRFACTVLLITLALTLTSSFGTPRWRTGLLAVLAVAALGWSAWAGVWADLYRANPAYFSTHDPTGLSMVWDLALATGAAAFAIVLWKRPERPPTWLVTCIGLLAIGALLDGIVPLRVTEAVWTRIGTLGAALVLTSTSVTAPWAVETRESAAAVAAKRLRRIVRSETKSLRGKSLTAEPVAVDRPNEARDQVRVPTYLARAEAEAVADLRDRIGTLDAQLAEATRESSDARAALEMYSGSLERLPIGLVVLDPVGRVIISNPEAERRLGVSLDVGASMPTRLQPSVADSLSRALRAVRTTGRARLEADIAGARRAFELQALLDERGALSGSLLIIDPGDGVIARAGELVPSLVEALRGPVRSLLAFSTVVTGTPRLPEADIERHFAVIDSTLRNLDVLLGDLCTVLEIEQGAPAPNRPGAIADVADVLRSCVEKAQPQLKGKDIDVALKVDGWLPPALVDTQVLGQIIDNLLTNAAACSPYGSRATLWATIVVSGGGRPSVRVRLDYRDRGTATSTDRDERVTAARPALMIARVLTERASCTWREGVDENGGARVEVRIPARVA